MKWSLIISLLTCFNTFITLELRSQSPAELLAKTWQFKMPTSINETNNLGAPVAPAHSEIADISYQFKVINILANGDLVIKFLHWSVPLLPDKSGFDRGAAASPNAVLNERFYMNNYLTNNFTPAKAASFRYFIITRSEFDSQCEEKFSICNLQLER